MRGHFFRVIQEHDVAEDTMHCLDILKTLTDNGKNIKDFEDSIGAFMVQWIQVVVDEGVTESYLEVLVNMIKYNAAHLENNDLVGIVQYVRNKKILPAELNGRCKLFFFCCSFQKCLLPQLPHRRHTNRFAMSAGTGRGPMLPRYTNRNVTPMHCCLMSHR